MQDTAAVGRGRRHARGGLGTSATRGRALVASCSARCRPRSVGAPTRSCATSSPSACSACRATTREISCRSTLGDAGRERRGPEQRRACAGARRACGWSRSASTSRRRCAATLFADQGARWSRSSGPVVTRYRADAARFAAWNRGKRVGGAGPARPTAATQALALIDDADLLVENLRRVPWRGSGSRPRRSARAPARASSPARSPPTAAPGPSRDDPGWEPLVHARAGAQQGMFTGDDADLAPVPDGQHRRRVARGGGRRRRAGQARDRPGTASTSRRRCSTRCCSSTRPRSSTARDHRLGVGRDTQVTRSATSRHGRRPRSADQPERHRALARAVPARRARSRRRRGLDFANAGVAGEARRSGVVPTACSPRSCAAFAQRRPTSGRQRCSRQPAAVAKCNTLDEWLAHEQAQATSSRASRRSRARSGPLVGPADAFRADATRSGGGGPPPARCGSRARSAATASIDMSSFWAGPLAARLLAELGADVVKVEPPGGEGGYPAHAGACRTSMSTATARSAGSRSTCAAPRTGNVCSISSPCRGCRRRERGGRARGSGSGSARTTLRAVNPALVYARAKGFGLYGPLAVAAVVRLRGAGRHRHGDDAGRRGGRVPVNFTANDYCTGLHLAAGIVLALLARARGAGVTSVEALADDDRDASSSPSTSRRWPFTARRRRGR